MPPPNMSRLHWSPVEPSWIVSGGLVLLAVLPHQVPVAGRGVLRHPVGALLFTAVAAFVFWKTPVLGVAMLLFLAGVILMPSHEPFAATNLNKDKVTQKQNRWYQEEVLSEDPHGIQDLAEDNLTYDEVTRQDSTPWQDEATLGVKPLAIQEKVLSAVPEYDEGSGSTSYGHH